MNDRAAGYLAIGSIGDLCLDARAEITGVLVDAERNPDMRLAGLVESNRTLSGLVIALPVTAPLAIDVVIPSQRGKIRLLVDDPPHVAVRHRLSKVIARLDVDHGLA